MREGKPFHAGSIETRQTWKGLFCNDLRDVATPSRKSDSNYKLSAQVVKSSHFMGLE